MRNSRNAFTMLELIFVIVIMGILSKFGVELLLKTYESYSRSLILNKLVGESEVAVQQIANRLQYRIKDSELADGQPLLSNAGGEGRLEWIGMDHDGWNGITSTAPAWSGIIDLNQAGTSKTTLVTPGSTSITVDDAIIFIGANRDVLNGLWSNDVNTTQSHQVTAFTAGPPAIITIPDSASSRDVWEYYKVANSAYAINTEDFDGDGINDLVLYYDYKPWLGETWNNDGSSSLLLNHVAAPGFSFQKFGDIVKIEVCVSSNNFTGEGEYKICKNKVIF